MAQILAAHQSHSESPISANHTAIHHSQIDMWRCSSRPTNHKGCSQFQSIRPNILGILGHFPNRLIPLPSYWGYLVLDKAKSITTTLVDFIRPIKSNDVIFLIHTPLWTPGSDCGRGQGEIRKFAVIICCNDSRVVTANYRALVQIAFHSEKQRSN